MPKHTTITKAAADRFKAKTGRVDHFDSSYPGLALRVSDSGRKAWTYFFRLKNGKVKLHRMTLGVYPAMSVEQAHQAWREAYDFVQAGRDPRAAGAVGAAAPTDIEGVIEEWIKKDQSKFRTAQVVKRRMQLYVIPSWKHRDVREISRRNCLDLIDSIADRGTVIAARRVHAHLHRFFNWCIGRGIIDANPLLNAEKPGSEVSRDRVLDEVELVAVWRAASEIAAPYRDAVRLLILTGARRAEISSLRWDEIRDGAISLEGARTKNGKPHIIPLSAPARAVLGGLERKGEFVFTITGAVPIVNWGRAKKALDEISGITDWRIHDIRRTVATGLQKLGTPLTVTEAVLGHVSGSRGGIVGVYQRHDYVAEKASALESWGARVIDLVEGREPGKVVAFGGR
jgi:integrase